MKLYDLPKGAKIKEDVFTDDGEFISDTIIFDHIDGMYSYCQIKDSNEIIHLSATTELKKDGDHYIII
jgi:hypothetical protein